MPAFRQLLDAVTEAWRDDGGRVRGSGGADRGAAGRQRRRRAAARRDWTPSALDGRRRDAGGRVRRGYGGFGGAPKFPPSMTLEFLLRHHERTGTARRCTSPRAPRRGWPAAACTTSSRAGSPGTASTRAGWCRTSRRCSTTTRCCCGSTRTWPGRRARALRSPGASRRRPPPSCCATSARPRAASPRRSTPTPTASRASPTSGRPPSCVEVLGATTARGPRELLEVTPEGTFEHGASTLQLPADPDDPARWARVRAALLAARDRRPQPARDDKVVTAWNGLAVAALAEAGAALAVRTGSRPRARPRTCCSTLHVVDGRLRRASRDGAVGAAAGVLEDHAFLADALLALHQATGARAGSTGAGELLDLALAQFADPDGARRLLRHRRRRRGAAAPAPRDHRQRQPVRGVRAGGRAPHRVGAGERRPAVPRRRRGGAAGGGDAGTAVPAVRRALADRRRGAARGPLQVAVVGARRPAATPCSPTPGASRRAARGRGRRAGRAGRPVAGRPAARRRGGPRLTSAAASCATAP